MQNEEFFIELLTKSKDELIESYDWLVEKKSLRNFDTHHISFNRSAEHIQECKNEPYIIGMIKNEMNQSIINLISRKLFNTNYFDFMDFTSECSELLQQHKVVRKIYERLLENNYKNVLMGGHLGAVLQDLYEFYGSSSRVTLQTVLIYNVGKLSNFNIFVDPYMKFNDDRICLFDEVQINICNLNVAFSNEATFSPRINLKYDMDFYIPSSKLIYILTEKNSENYKHCESRIISLNRDIKIDKLLNDK